MATLAANGDMYRPAPGVAHRQRAHRRAPPASSRCCSQRLGLKPENVEFVKKRHGRGQQVEGTGARSFGNAQYSSGGKTGTAQVIGMKQGEKYDEKKINERHRDHSLFIVFAPVESPKHRADGDRGERRLRCPRRGADRAHGARLLPARQGARVQAARARRAVTKAKRRATDASKPEALDDRGRKATDGARTSALLSPRRILAAPGRRAWTGRCSRITAAAGGGRAWRRCTRPATSSPGARHCAAGEPGSGDGGHVGDGADARRRR